MHLISEVRCARCRKKRRRKGVRVNVRRTLEISGCMTSLAHLASGYEVGSCAAPQLAQHRQLLRRRPVSTRAQLSSFTIMYGRPLKTGSSRGLTKSRYRGFVQGVSVCEEEISEDSNHSISHFTILYSTLSVNKLRVIRWN